jgi:hypothetical protein
LNLREILITLGYVAWWALGGWMFGVGINALFRVEVATVCALGNVIAGLLLLLPVVADEHRRRLFYEGPHNDEPPDLWIGLLWAFPSTGLFLGLLWWLMGRLS